MIQTFWIVWNENGDRCNFPTRKHFSKAEANKEAERLAEKHKGESFSVMQLIGTVKTINIQWEFVDNIPF